MITFVVRRLAAAVVLLFVVSSATFVIFFVIPKLGGQTPEQLAMQYMGKSPTPEAVAAAVHSLGFDRPVYVQYGNWLHTLLAGGDFDTGTVVKHCPAPCLGFSLRDQVAVLPRVTDAFPVTLSLTIGASVLWLLFGVAAGVLSALRPHSLFDRLAMGTALAGVSVPIFVTAPLVLLLVVYKGNLLPHPAYHPFFGDPFLWAQGLLLPWIVLAFQFAALYARLTRAGMLDAIGEDYIRTARAKGLSERRVMAKHALRAVLTPVLTIFGMDFGLLLGGAVLTESSFDLHGIGKVAIDGIGNNDLPVVLGVVLFAATFIILANLIVDLLYGVIDPRVRKE
ncbi:MAG: ABC transporter permease [Catenulispora sp.]|nr:ABC transporter permease [Catenulispora sp.]